jgi:hypothetical protein
VADPLHVYLQDHFAGATFGYELVARCRLRNEGTPFEAALAELTAEIAADRRALLGVMERLGAERSNAKALLAWASEKLSRLKPNDRPFSYTPLARFVELETLAIGIGGKRALWRALETVEPAELFDGCDLEALAERAEEQLETVERLRLEAARLAFVDRTGSRALTAAR